jgi:hypothetical protein
MPKTHNLGKNHVTVSPAKTKRHANPASSRSSVKLLNEAVARKTMDAASEAKMARARRSFGNPFMWPQPRSDDDQPDHTKSNILPL